ncbi:MAG: N-6 DNA methylase, partial [Prevotellaceae bacterium]|nr:N-6 DNA methylase [Prevotellaceae bacterium]
MQNANFNIEETESQVKQYLAYFELYPNGEEIQYRTPFENFFNGLRLPFQKKITIIQEDRHSSVDIDGIPDFFIYEEINETFKSLVGFIECKKPSYNLDKLIVSEQIKKYSVACENIILTNYHRFILLQKGKKQYDIVLSLDNKVLLDFFNLLQDFYYYKYPYIKTKKTLVTVLAAQSFYYSTVLRKFLQDKDNEQKERNFYRKLNGLFSGYENSLNYHYELEDFCDVYSQTLVFGLLLARLDTEEELNEKDLDYLKKIPLEYRLLKEFLSNAYESEYLPVLIKIALTNIGKNLNLIDIEAIQKEFDNVNNGRQNIYVYLYEDFLKEYDKLCSKDNRKKSGVYYTPCEATNFITRSVNHLIKTKLNIAQGYNAENVKVLDFACGTGTFLHSVFEQMIPETSDKLTIQILKQKIIKDIYGFELLFTPYIIAHTFLVKFLKEKNIFLKEKERLGIYLTNTLDISQHSISDLLPNLQHEYETATEIKDKTNLLAIIGNPPYFNGKSQAKKGVIDGELKKYKTGLKEQNIQPLEDIYIKFICFAERKIEKSGHGIVGIIVNNSWLNGLVHRQMRKHLYETFDEIYVMNLHGDADRKEPDKNIFDIKRGICISIFVKKQKPAKQKKAYYFSTLENNLISRAEKLSFLENTDFSKIAWQEVKPTKTENYWFIPKDFSEKKTYEKFWKLTDIFEVYNSGVQTKRDKLILNYD